MTSQYIKIPLEDLTALKDEMSNAESMVLRITTALLEEDLDPYSLEQNMQHISSWLDDKQAQLQKLIDESKGA
ncbi:hypothetical protein H0262_06725 [Psychrobacter cryohalolentis]|uniref:hypothetical protein n=1 Tax=Psychrobacter sp. D2 TaxID=2759702 RepID=UPI0015E62157|nr:hypothetical protein [Psychrobacter sp. D2]MBA2057573.1 hypothetical protein [Psychrobacter sp. D2]